MVKQPSVGTYNRQVGIYGENVAEHYLVKIGHTIVSRNLRLKSGEIDILSYKDNYLYINEVKTGSGGSTVLPEYNLTRSKLIRLRKLAVDLESLCYTRNSFTINLFKQGRPPVFKGFIVNGICVYLTLNTTLDKESLFSVSKIRVKLFSDIFNP
jgi:Holliday junction resolvase-like predicted endonuclease